MSMKKTVALAALGLIAGRRRPGRLRLPGPRPQGTPPDPAPDRYPQDRRRPRQSRLGDPGPQDREFRPALSQGERRPDREDRGLPRLRRKEPLHRLPGLRLPVLQGPLLDHQARRLHGGRLGLRHARHVQREAPGLLLPHQSRRRPDGHDARRRGRQRQHGRQLGHRLLLRRQDRRRGLHGRDGHPLQEPALPERRPQDLEPRPRPQPAPHRRGHPLRELLPRHPRAPDPGQAVRHPGGRRAEPQCRGHALPDLPQERGGEGPIRARRQSQAGLELERHPRRHDQPGLQPDRGRRAQDRLQCPLRPALRREAAVLPGGHGDLQLARDRDGLHAPDQRPHLRGQGLGQDGPVHLRRAFGLRHASDREPLGHRRRLLDHERDQGLFQYLPDQGRRRLRLLRRLHPDRQGARRRQLEPPGRLRRAAPVQGPGLLQLPGPGLGYEHRGRRDVPFSGPLRRALLHRQALDLRRLLQGHGPRVPGLPGLRQPGRLPERRRLRLLPHLPRQEISQPDPASASRAASARAMPTA